MKGFHCLISDKNLDSVCGLLIFKYSCASNVNSEKNIKKKDRFVFFLVELVTIHCNERLQLYKTFHFWETLCAWQTVWTYESFYRTRTISTQHWNAINMAGASTVWHSNFGKEEGKSAKIKLYKERMWSAVQIRTEMLDLVLVKVFLVKKDTNANPK